MRAIPKVELHRHLDGSLRFETVFERGQRLGIFNHLKTNGMSAEDFKKIVWNKVKILSPMDNLQAVLDSFWLTQKVMADPTIIEQVAFENVEDCYQEGVVLAELRFAPVFMAVGKQLTYDSIIQSVCRGVEKALRKFPIEIGLIYIIPRGLDFLENQASTRALAQLLHCDPLVKKLVVGADLADIEIKEEMPRFVPMINELRELGLKITIHSGEDSDASFLERTFALFRPQRIGHGIKVMEDPKVLAQALELGIHFEVCPTSNYLTRCVPSLQDHPIRKMMESGLSLSINSDDPHLMNIDLAHEYTMLKDVHKFTSEEFLEVNKKALSASFLPEERKKYLAQKYFTFAPESTDRRPGR
ncbi:MAG: adenosine deaminase [Bdellovibrionales bacterium GWA2_49_15]|nr:MAG: adenosine deaminase [Bdellovibrionales bacterium GWA2_49_15]HAZ12695.1 adenosine deaminase [Bdellovibrionales bacterium]